MSLVKAAGTGMAYESAGTKKVDGRAVMRKEYKNAVDKHSTLLTVWLLVVKHRVGLFIAGDVILVMNFILPEWPQLMLGLIGK